MPKFFVKHEQDFPWQVHPKHEAVSQKFVNEGTDGTPEVFFVQNKPGYTSRVHSHSQDEVIYVLEGEVSVGGRRCPAGTVVYVQKDTLYGPLVAGPQGVKFINIRPAKATAFIKEK